MIEAEYVTTKDGERISYRHYKNGHDDLVIIVHGFFNSKNSTLLTNFCEYLSKDHDVFIFDLRGHGKSSGFFTWTSKESNDLTAVLNYLDGKYEKTALIAFSMGASVSINVLAETNATIDSFVCVSAPSDFSKIDYRPWRVDWRNDIYYSLLTKGGRQGKGVRAGPFWLTKKKPIDNIGQINIPILFIHGSRDLTVDEWHSQALYEKATVEKKRLAIIENGPHAEYLIKEYPEKAYKVINTWLESTLS